MPFQLLQSYLREVYYRKRHFRKVLAWTVPNFTILIGWQVKRRAITSTRERGREIGSKSAISQPYSHKWRESLAITKALVRDQSPDWALLDHNYILSCPFS